MLAPAVLVLALPCPSPAEVLFSDDFDDGAADGWFELPTGATYEVTDGWYHFLMDAPDDAVAGSSSGDQSGSMSVPDYSLRAALIIDAGLGGLATRFTGISWQGYIVALEPEMDMAAIIRCDGFSVEPTALAILPITIELGQVYWVRFEVSGDLLGAKIWQGTVEDEPSEWMLLAQDGTYSSPGSIGLGALDSAEGGTASLDCSFDEVAVTDELSLELDPVTWAEIKASGLR